MTKSELIKFLQNPDISETDHIVIYDLRAEDKAERLVYDPQWQANEIFIYAFK